MIERINGIETLSVANPSLLLRGNVGKQVLLHVKPGSGGDVRRVIVTPVSFETARGVADTLPRRCAEQPCLRKVFVSAGTR